MAWGDYQVDQLWSPPGQRVVQVQGTPPSKSESGWEWADRLGQFELLDNSGAMYRPRGAWAMVKLGPDDRLAARYNAEGSAVVTDLPRGGRPTDVWIAFLVPEKSSLRELRLSGKRITSISQQVN
jgi:hypothetical protein